MVTQNDDLRNLLFEARSGDRASAGHLAGLVQLRIYPLVRRTIADPDAAEDIVQDTLLSVLLNLKSLRDNDKFWPWVWRIAACRIRGHIRRRRLRSAGKATVALDLGSKDRPQDRSVLDFQIRAERLRQVADVVDQLSHEHRDIIRLRYYEQLSYAQIASRTRISPKIARSRSFRARQCLKACLVYDG